MVGQVLQMIGWFLCMPHVWHFSCNFFVHACCAGRHVVALLIYFCFSEVDVLPCECVLKERVAAFLVGKAVALRWLAVRARVDRLLFSAFGQCLEDADVHERGGVHM